MELEKFDNYINAVYCGDPVDDTKLTKLKEQS
jgi:hypothetical protein